MASHKLPPLPALRDFVHIYRLTARKILSQNYLMDMNITRKLVRSAGIEPGAYVVEIGPGPGGITRAILEQSIRRCDVIELDKRFMPALEPLVEASENRLFVHHGDALKFDIEPIWAEAKVPKHDWLDEPPNMHLIGNLPFDIASPLIIKYLREMSRRRGPWAFGRVPLTLTFQLEVAKRICGKVSTLDRARISLVSQYVAEPKFLFEIPGRSFTPKPDVAVGVVKFVPRFEPLVQVVQKVVRHLFMYKNKEIHKCLKTMYPDDMADDLTHELLSYARVDPNKTSHNVGIEELADMSVCYDKQCRRFPGLFLYYFEDKQPLEFLKNKPNAVPRVYGFTMPELNKEGISIKEFDTKWIPTEK